MQVLTALKRRHTMPVSTTFQEIAANNRPTPQQTYFFMINSLLSSRIESGFPSNDGCYDEDVNVYLAHLLTTFIYPENHEWMFKYIVPYDTGLFEEISGFSRPHTKYLAYRSNADMLLFSIGIFSNPTRRRPHSVPHMSMSEDAFIGRGKAYYRLAQSYSLKTFRKSTAISEILGKLSLGFEKYIAILSLMKGEYLNFYRKMTNGELYHLFRCIELTGQHGELESLYDSFLDAYSNYKRDKSPSSKELLEKAADRLRRIDPYFRFDAD